MSPFVNTDRACAKGDPKNFIPPAALNRIAEFLEKIGVGA